MTPRRIAVLRGALIVCARAMLSAHAATPATDPATVVEQIGSMRLDVARAAEVSGAVLDLGAARLTLIDGVVIPATEAGGRTLELVHLGRARFELDPPDDVEARQLRQYTHRESVDVVVGETVIVIGDEAVSEPLLSGSPVVLDDDRLRRSRELYGRWIAVAHADGFGAGRAVFKAALGDTLLESYRAAWCPVSDLGAFLYVLDPEEREQVRLGRFEIRPAEDAEATPEVDALTWVACPLTRDGRAVHGGQGVEPDRYRLELTIATCDKTSEGRAELELRAESDGIRAVGMTLFADLKVTEILDGEDRPLAFRRSGDGIDVALPRALETGEKVRLAVSFEGNLLEDTPAGAHVLRSHDAWYPRVGTVDRAAYEATFRWPSDLQLFAGGSVVEQGDEQGQRWQRTTLDLPANGYSFRVGRYDVVSETFGPVELTVAFDTRAFPRIEERQRRDVLSVLKASLAFYSKSFGMYPLRHMTVVTVPEDVSRGYLGFITYSHELLFEPRRPVARAVESLAGPTMEQQRVEILAHEVSHQWWGNRLGWYSYREAWLSEAIADYSAMVFSKKLWPDAPLFMARRAEGWRESLATRTADGRTYESLGPLVLGPRLAESAYGAYQAVIYDKGAVAFSTLALALGEDALLEMLGNLAQAVDNRVIATDTFLRSLEHMSGRSLAEFAERFVYGTGIPEIYYRYTFERRDDRWVVRAQARQLPVIPFNHRLARDSAGVWRVTRALLDDPPPSDWALTVPFQVAVGEPGPDTVRIGAGLGGTVTLTGPVTSFEVPLDAEPHGFWLDQRGEVLAEFIDQGSPSIAALRRLGFRLAMLERHDEARESLEEALVAIQSAPDTSERRRDEGEIRLQLARLELDRDRPEDSRAELDRATRLLAGEQGILEIEPVVIAARLDLRMERYGAAFDRLTQPVSRWHDIALSLPAARIGPSFDDLFTEASLVLAAAAYETGHLRTARQSLDYVANRAADARVLEELLARAGAQP